MDGQQGKPSFFTIIREGLNTQHMRIPPKFLKYLDKDFLSNAILVGPSGDQWQVTIIKRGNDMYLHHGWPKFLIDNLVMLDEFLTFTYDGKKRFQVHIFGKNGCDRLCFRKARQFEAATPSKVRRKKNGQRPTSAVSLGLHESKPSQEDLALRNKGSFPMNYSSMPHISPKIERSNECKLAEVFTSNNPCFKHLMKKSNVDKVCTLPIATEFARKYLPPLKVIILQNSLGKYWEVSVACNCVQDRRYYRFSKGWATFVHGNNLKIGDTCIFELKGGNNMRVHIFRCAPN